MAAQVALSRMRAAGGLRDLSKIFRSRPLPDQKSISFIPGVPVRLGGCMSSNSRSLSICPSHPQLSRTFGTEKTRHSVARGLVLHSRSVMTAAGLDGMSLGFYGGGMMAEAILKGLLNQKTIPPEKVWVCELIPARREQLAKLGVSVTADGEEMLSNSDTVFLAVKPNVVPIVLKTVTKHEQENKDADLLLISICAGVNLEALSEGNPGRNCVRLMPNQPCLVGEAASAFTLSEGCSQSHREIVEALMGACGLLSEIPEKSHDAVAGLSGSGPAYVYMMMEAMSDAGVRGGLPRAVARQLAAQTVLGAAKMALEMPDVHLGELRNRVESPGGTTIAASAILESHGFRSAVIEAVTKATERSKEMGRKE